MNNKKIKVSEKRDSGMKKKSLRKKNKYDVFNYALCVECIHFQSEGDSRGSCLLLESAGEYSGVMAQAVCDGFLSGRGTDINGKQLDIFPPWLIKEPIGNTWILRVIKPLDVLKSGRMQ